MGVAIFSMIMGNFIDIIGEFMAFYDELDDSENLEKFFNILRKFNNDEPLSEEFKDRIMKYFEYRWVNDQN